MPLSALQIEVLRSPKTRTAFPDRKQDFAYADSLLKLHGTSCTRLVAVWDKIFPSTNPVAQQWLLTNFKLSPRRPVINEARPAPNSKPAVSVVNRAITVLSSYRNNK